MKTQTAPTGKPQDGTLFYIVLLTGFLILLEISFFIQCNRAYLGDFDFVSHRLHIPVQIIVSVGYFIFVQLLIHLAFALVIYIGVCSLLYWLPPLRWRVLTITIGTWTLGVVTIFMANLYYFPNSKFAILFHPWLVNVMYIKWIYYILLTTSFLLFIPTMLFLLRWKTLLPTLAIGLTLMAYQGLSPVETLAGWSTLPNIIIIGVDSLRPDFLGFFNGEANTPFFDRFLTKATVFSEAITPLARTFPSWVSILTGKYPIETDIRFNLADYRQVDLSESLGVRLQKLGYQTVYATDETRFSNIDHPFGFEQMITPPIGLGDFLIGTFNDFPFSNLLINTRVGKWLFPYSYSNRAVYHTYDPDTFLTSIQNNLHYTKSKPLFLATHFCLPHYPYGWNTLPMGSMTVWQKYLASVERVDKQINDFMVYLKQNHVLDHALLVLLSDHGEALEFAGDRITTNESYVQKDKIPPKFYPPSLDDERIDQSAGHGTDVLGLPQYHTLLAFKFYDDTIKQPARILTGPVSLLDIKPTIMAYLQQPQQASGQSLLSVIKGESTLSNAPKHLFLESDYSPEAIRTVYPETRKVLLEGIALFQIDPLSMRLTVKKKMGKMIIHSKQVADIFGEWMLALYPQNKNDRLPILINLRSGEWTDDLQSPFALRSPAAKMLQALHEFYGVELTTF